MNHGPQEVLNPQLCNHSELYSETRHTLKTGDLVLFPRLTLADVSAAREGQRYATLWGWRSNFAICLIQILTCLKNWRDGFNSFPHVGMVYVRECSHVGGNKDHREVYILESLSTPDPETGRTGPRLTRFSERLLSYAKPLLIIPVRSFPDWGGIENFERELENIRTKSYDYPGLLGALTSLGIDSPESYFCSELVVHAWQLLGWMPKRRLAPRFIRSMGKTRYHLRSIDLRPSAFTPSECARQYGVVDAAKAWWVEKDYTTKVRLLNEQK